ncbi:MAG TPA: MarR family transcriptional regulator [Gemmatimonadaceae bacterium]|nr:MarR family transcriptional regulator [Gemmatimonadaceae bacterium]
MAPPPRSRKSPDPDVVADRLHSAAIHILRRVRREDTGMGLSAPRASALSVVVFGGPITLGALAATEQVRPPTMTHLVRALEALGLVTRVADPEDGRIVRIAATRRGTRLLAAGRARRVRVLSRQLRTLSKRDLATLARAAELLDGLSHD